MKDNIKLSVAGCVVSVVAVAVSAANLVIRLGTAEGLGSAVMLLCAMIAVFLGNVVVLNSLRKK